MQRPQGNPDEAANIQWPALEGFMRSTAYRLLFLAVAPVAILFLLSAVAFADCAAPSSPGVRICSPTPNAVVVYIPEIDFNVTPVFGAEIVGIIVYDNSRKVGGDSGTQTNTMLFDADMTNGLHRLVVKAWDNSGKLYQGTVSFRVTGEGYDGPQHACSVPSSPGINFCQPPSGILLGGLYRVSAAAKGASAIAAIRLYVDDKSLLTQFNVNELTTDAFAGRQGDHKLTFVAWDKSGHVYSSTRTIHSTYTYGWFGCPGNDQPCLPGYDRGAVIPQPNTHVGNSFIIEVDVLSYPRLITTSKAYIDSTLVATSHGPNLMAHVENAPSGTHILTIQAWDRTGALYRVQYNININVPH
jgi:hypothetical protein